MLRLLLCLSALGLLAGAAPVTHTGSATIDISACPITFYGQQFSTIYMSINGTGRTWICFDSAQTTDCLLITKAMSQNFVSEVPSNVSSVTPGVESAITGLTAPALCGVKISLTMNGAMDIYFISYGTQAAVHIAGAVASGDMFSFIAGGKRMKAMAAAVSSSFTVNVPIIACRSNDSVVNVNSQISSDPSACTTTTCAFSGLPTVSPNCGSSQICLGNGFCSAQFFCSIVGPSVVDFANHVGAVPDLCSYDILKGPAGFSVTARYRERRLTDKGFVDQVIITTTNDITLYQGGHVEVYGISGVNETLSSTPTTYLGVALTKDQTGVTAVYKDSNNIETTVFYDGTLLHITHKVPASQTAYSGGLCADLTTGFSTNKNTTFSYPGCDTVVPDGAGVGINCTAVTTRCTTALNSLSSPLPSAPFVTACADKMLCHYPEADGLLCNFLDAYARTSQLQNWRDSVGCSVTVCLNHQCTDHEFCAVTVGGDPACYCRSADTTLNTYKENGEYGPPATCSSNSASLTLYTCFLEEKGIDPSGLHLTDPTCTGTSDPNLHEILFTFDSTNTCQGTYAEQGNKIIFTNTIQNTQSSTVAFEGPVSINFSCAYTQPDVSTASFKIADGSVSLTYTTGDFTFTMDVSLFIDAGFTNAVSPTSELQLNQKVWVKLGAQGVGGNSLALVINDCWTTTESLSTGANRYNLITSGCAAPTDGTVEILSSGQSVTSVFTFHTYEYVGVSTTDIYLHCQVSLCIIANGCVPSCSGSVGP